MPDALAAMKAQLAWQVSHWSAAAGRLQNLDDLASPQAWSSLEQYLGLTIRQHLAASLRRLEADAAVLRAALEGADAPTTLELLRRRLLDFRKRYLRTETTLDFYADAINTRTSPTVCALLRSCDSIAHRSMAQVLDQTGHPTPVVLTYIDKGLGAAILKADLRLWDGGLNPAASIKITRHNLLRPTALLHEAGHQVAHIAGWNEELAAALQSGLEGVSRYVAETWSSWATEIAADAHAFVHTGYASVAALHDVVADADPFRFVPGDPHPVGYLRVLLGVEMCRRFFGAGPWDGLALAWTASHPPERAGGGVAALVSESLPLLPRVVEIALRAPARAFGGRPLCALVNPDRVKPESLEALERQLGAALYNSMHWVWTESVRLLALTGLRLATAPERAQQVLRQQQDWMIRLGGTLQAA